MVKTEKHLNTKQKKQTLQEVSGMLTGCVIGRDQ